jgi:hypothetical protein
MKRLSVTFVAIVALTLGAFAAPALAHHRPGHPSSRTPAPTAQPPASLSPSPEPPSPEPGTVESSEQPSPDPTSYPIVYEDEYWVLLERWPSGYAPSPCEAIWPPPELCHATFLPYWFYPDATWGYCPWYADPTVPSGWSVYECDPWADLGF